MRLLLCVAFAALVLSGQLALAEDDIVTWGAGAHTCANFANDYKARPAITDAHLRTWIMGYLSGLNEMSYRNGGDMRKLNALELDGAITRIMIYCDEHPLMRIVGQLGPMYDALPVLPRAAR